MATINNMLTKQQAAHELGVSRATVERALEPDYYYGNKAMYTREAVEKAKEARIHREPNSTIGEKRRNMLTLQQQIKLAEWVKNRVDEFITQNMSFDKAAHTATKELGYAVSVGNIKAVNDALGTKWLGNRTKANKQPGTMTTDIAQLRKDLDAVIQTLHAVGPALTALHQNMDTLNANHQLVADVLHRLCAELGSPGLCDDLGGRK